MTEEANLIEREGGLEPEGDGWFVVNVRNTSWWTHEAFGSACRFEGSEEASRFMEIGVNIRVLRPGQPNCMYHEESIQEDFLVLSGSCLLLVEGRERPLEAWDFVHCAPWTEHVFVGAGEGPCAILMIGARRPEASVRYPVSELARSHGAGVERETTDPGEAYAAFPDRVRRSAPADGLPWGA